MFRTFAGARLFETLLVDAMTPMLNVPDPFDEYIHFTPRDIDYSWLPITLTVVIMSDNMAVCEGDSMVDVAMTHGIATVGHMCRSNESLGNYVEEAINRIRRLEAESGLSLLKQGVEEEFRRSYVFYTLKEETGEPDDLCPQVSLLSNGFQAGSVGKVVFVARDFRDQYAGARVNGTVPWVGREYNWGPMYSHMVKGIDSRRDLDLSYLSTVRTPKIFDFLAQDLLEGFSFEDFAIHEDGGFVGGCHIFTKRG
jgi:hypothetical protein